MAPQLEQVGTIRAFLGPKEHILPLGPTRGQGSTQRIVIPVPSGFIKTTDFEGSIIPGGSDWLLLDTAGGVAHLDVRAQARSADGEMLYTHYTGLFKVDEMVQKFLEWSPEARTTESKDHYFVSTPVFEVSSERLKWMEQTAFVAHGHFVAPGDGSQAVEYELYKVVSA